MGTRKGETHVEASRGAVSKRVAAPMLKRVAAAIVVLGLLAPLSAQRLDPDITARIRQEANAHSQIMRTLHFLTDVYGPRLTGSPSLKASGEWAIRTMESWGLNER